MSTLTENVAKVRSAHANLKTAIAAKGVAVPDWTKLSDMPALVEQIPSEPAYTSDTNFYHDSARTNIVVPGVIYVDFTKATNINSCFSRCMQLTSLFLPEGFGTNALTANLCFGNCTALTSLKLPEGFGQNLTAASGIFYRCSALTSLHLPAGFGQNVTTTFIRTFNGCSSLETITGNPVFKATLGLSDSPKLTHDSLMVIINGLQTVTTTQTFRMGSTNLAKLTEAEKKIATDKGWTLA